MKGNNVDCVKFDDSKVNDARHEYNEARHEYSYFSEVRPDSSVATVLCSFT